MALAVGADVELLSIRPGQVHSGIAFPKFPGWSGDIDAAIAPPGPFTPSELRRIIEMRMAVALAGELAETLGPPPPPGFRPDAECVSTAEPLAPRDPAYQPYRHKWAGSHVRP